VETGGIAVETDPISVFGNVLRALRERARLSQKQLADMVFCSASMISAIETGAKRAQLDLVQRIDEALKAGGALIHVWPITAEGTYPSWFAQIAELEAEAIKIHEWEMRYIPGLLQTADYARAVMYSNRPRPAKSGDDDESIERDVTTRMERQEILTRDDPPRAWFIIEESVLYRPFGNSAAMAKQLEHLESMAELANVIIQVLPLEATGHSGSEGPLKIIEFSGAPPIGYTEGRWSGRIIESGSEFALAMSHFDLIRASALPPGKSIERVSEIRSDKYG
jgi:transcriptional regulator with XRE-family HTH domain